MLDSSPIEVEAAIDRFLIEASIDVMPIEKSEARTAIEAFTAFVRQGRHHPAQLNLADCLSYACAKNRQLGLLYKGDEFLGRISADQPVSSTACLATARNLD